MTQPPATRNAKSAILPSRHRPRSPSADDSDPRDLVPAQVIRSKRSRISSCEDTHVDSQVSCSESIPVQKQEANRQALCTDSGGSTSSLVTSKSSTRSKSTSGAGLAMRRHDSLATTTSVPGQANGNNKTVDGEGPSVVGASLSSRATGSRNVPQRRKFKIHPFKQAPRVAEGFCTDAWLNFLLPAVQAVHQARNVPFSLELLYGKVEDACMQKHAPELFKNLRNECEANVQSQVKLLENLMVEADAFLRVVDATWQRHCSQMLRIRAIFLKLDRTYLVQGCECGTRSLWDMGLQQFRQAFATASDVESKTVSSLLGLINNERDGEAIDHSRVRSLVRMFSAINTYDECFLRPFLESTSNYYRAESERLISEFDTPVYLRHVEQRLSAERERASQSLDVCSVAPLISLVETRLITDHVQTILSKGFDTMCDERRKEDLGRCFKLFERASLQKAEEQTSAHELMLQYMLSYVERAGLDIVNDVEKDSDMVQELLRLKARVDDLIESSFGGSDMFKNTAKRAFETFVNARENKPAELIARFLDGVLRTGNKSYSEEELENILDRVLNLFKFINGKDVFEAFYKRDLSKRLLHDKSASHDLEKTMISKLKAECGSSFTSKLEAMFRDVDASKDLMTSYRQSVKESRENSMDIWRLGYGGEIDLNVFVLEASRWPLSTQAGDTMNLPKELMDYQESFKKFYLSKHNGRKLTWQHSDGSCTVKAQFPRGTKILSVSLYQTLVLVLFNSRDEIGYSEIVCECGLQEAELKRTLLSLACGKVRVLQKRPKGPKVEKGDVFCFNDAFTHKQTRIKVNAIQMKETVEENSRTTEKVFQERSYQVDASIVRVMKTRRTLPHSVLIGEVFDQVKFPLKSTDIKKRIESLIEREYLERDKSDPQTYVYLA